MTDPFEVRGELSVRDSSTVLCVRRAEGGGSDPSPSSSFAERLRSKFGEEKLGANAFVTKLLRDGESFQFESGWEVLLGQSEVVNWLKTTREKIVTMRYPGEFKLAGGMCDEGESLLEAAKRELTEEFLRPAETQVPLEDIVLRPFSVKQTRPIRSKSNLMYNFVASSHENPWLSNLDVAEVNASLARRRVEFHAMVAESDEVFNMSLAERELVSPEVHELRWVPLEEAVENCLSSMLPGVYVNDWQQEEFAKLQRARRDPLVMTGAVLVELEMFPSVTSLHTFCESVDMDALRAAEQWLFHGMDSEQVEAAFEERTGADQKQNPSFKPLDLISEMRSTFRGGELSTTTHDVDSPTSSVSPKL